MSGMRRSKLEIITSILRAAMEDVNATHITYRANLNYVQLQSYLKLLIQNELIGVTEYGGNLVYRTTSKGRSLIKEWEKTMELLFI